MKNIHLAKKIIVGGDSFSDKNQPQTAMPEPLDFKMWPEIVGEKLHCEVLNTARCGYGNHAIYHQTLKAIMNNKDVDHVFVMWSEWPRQDFLLNDSNHREYVSIDSWDHAKIYQNVDNEVIDKWYDDSFNKNFPIQNDPKFTAPIPSMEQLTNTNINYIYALKVICEKLNIPYTSCQGTETCIVPSSLITQHPLGSQVFKEFTMVDLLKKEYGTKLSDFAISDKDAHPNERSQKFMANKMIEFAEG
jgi:hypothetical protein|tara:strand:- start:15 stop:752 length:738 start_codon:yes stop_codon:yes gene_type:complete